jgi:hypothetical protein
MVCFPGRSIVPRPYSVRVLLELPSAQSPFARPRCYLARRDLLDHVSRRYPAIIARTGSCVSPQPSLCLRSPPWSTGLCRLLSAPAGRRTFPTLLCTSFPACLDPSPGGSCGAHTRFFPHDSGLPRVRTGSALSNIRTATSVRRVFRGCSHSLMFRPAGLLTTPVAPTATDTSVWQPWFLRPSLSWVVTSPRPGYACRPNRVIDGRGLSPHKMRSLVGCTPNATRQARPMAALGRDKARCLPVRFLIPPVEGGSRTGAVAVGLGSCCLPAAFASCRCLNPSRGSVSSSLHVARSMRISRTTRPCSLRVKGYGTYQAGSAFNRSCFNRRTR